MSYSGLGAADGGKCFYDVAPVGWRIPPMGGCLWDASGCAQLAADALQLMSQPYWGMPVPNVSEQNLLAWVLRWGWLRSDATNSCTVTLAGDGQAYDPVALQQNCTASRDGGSSACAEAGLMAMNYAMPFQAWLENASAGVVIAERRMRVSDRFSYEWDVRNAKFYAPPPDRDFAGYIPQGLSPYVAANLARYVAGLKALMLGQQGKLSDVRDWFVVYAPNLSNAPTEWG